MMLRRGECELFLFFTLFHPPSDTRILDKEHLEDPPKPTSGVVSSLLLRSQMAQALVNHSTGRYY